MVYPSPPLPILLSLLASCWCPVPSTTHAISCLRDADTLFEAMYVPVNDLLLASVSHKTKLESESKNEKESEKFQFKLDEHSSELIGAAMVPQAPLMLPVHLISELDQMALTLVDAFMNCVKIEWDATRYVDKLPKKPARPGTAATKAQEAIMRRQYPPWNDSAANIPISRPCIVVDMQGVILAWYLPGILTDSRQSEMMTATQKLHPLLEKHPRSTSWCLDPEYFPMGLEGLQGLVDFLPAWFQQGHELISVEMVQEFPQVNTSLKKSAALEWLDCATELNSIMSAILAVIHPELYDASQDTLKVLRGHSEVQPQEILHQWTSVYSVATSLSFATASCQHIGMALPKLQFEAARPWTFTRVWSWCSG
ncbi:hypothetical protein EDB85DRAFT_1893533 [Lactarius pseudohatsudake]|nr:hypothetical protein EDB85DRAFT_1893533 [Lactarius pseudohatsudake]